MMYAVTAHFSPDEIILARMKPRKDIRGIGCSDWGYADLLAEKFDYVNTFYDHEPQLDLCNVDWSRWPPDSFDFITCTDVLEHVEPPVERTFENMRRLLKPGGVAILTVPTTLEPATREHFPDLHDWRIETEGKRAGRGEPPPRRHDRAIRQPLLPRRRGAYAWSSGLSRGRVCSTASKQAGLRVAAIYDRPVQAHAIPLGEQNFVLTAERS